MLQFQRAQRSAVKLKILLTGPSGAGKTLGALRIAEGIAPGKIALIDSENDRSAYYADRLEFDVLSLTDHRPRSYVAALDAAVGGGYQVVIIDSISQAWSDVLGRKSAYDASAPHSNSWANWRTFSAEWERLVRHILDAPVHVICSARSKQSYETTDVGGRKSIVKQGMAPIAKPGLEYEFAVHFDLLISHVARALKDNTGKFDRGDAELYDLCDGSVPAALREWISTAKPVEVPADETMVAIEEAIGALPEARVPAVRKRWTSRLRSGLNDGDARVVLAAIQGMTAAVA